MKKLCLANELGADNQALQKEVDEFWEQFEELPKDNIKI
jgi:hypothetical protein